MLCSLQAENHRLAQELLLLRQQQQHGIARREAPARSSPSAPPASASGNSSSSKSDAGASTASDGGRHQASKAGEGEGKSKSESSNNHIHADKQRLSVSAASTDPHASLDAEILRGLLHWGQALHKIRPKIGPGDTLYSTVEWLIQEHAKLMRLVSASVAPRCTSLAQVVTQVSASPPHAAADSDASSNSSQQTSPLLIVPHSDYKMSEAHEDYRVFSSLVRVPVDRPEHRQHPRVAHSSRWSEPGGAALGKGSLGSEGSAGQGRGAERQRDVSGDFLAGAADSHISEVSRCVRDRLTSRVCM